MTEGVCRSIQLRTLLQSQRHKPNDNVQARQTRPNIPDFVANGEGGQIERHIPVVVPADGGQLEQYNPVLVADDVFPFSKSQFIPDHTC